MKISVTNLGAIKEATVEIGGLTVFVGANGTGKSYLAKVIYGLQRFETLVINAGDDYSEDLQNIFFGTTVKTTEEVFHHLQSITPNVFWQIVPNLLNFYAELFNKSLSNYFNDDTRLFEKSSIRFSDIKPFSDDETKAIIEFAIQRTKDWLTVVALPQSTTLLENLLWLFCLIIFSKINSGWANYFPAARSNFMLTYKSLYRARADEHVGSDSIDQLIFANKGVKARKTGTLIRFDKPTEDFLSNLYDLDTSQKSPLASVADKLQTLLYGKDLLLVNQSEGSLPDFRYQVKNSENKLRLHLTSSMVTETSPLLIGLKHWIEPNSLVIIDEPESHLHPEAQRALVNGLAEAINQGLKVILITHSPYILSCVNNLIKFNRLVEAFPADKDVETLKNAHPEMVTLNKKVTAYHFGLDGIVKDIVLASGLIDEAEFTEPFDRINELYEAMRDIEWEHRQ
jgi:predicted ATP-dependent endonuclease of OLD family